MQLFEVAADAGAEALLGVRALAQDDFDQRRGLGADLTGLPRNRRSARPRTALNASLQKRSMAREL
jgi:hypothetical protein